MERHLEQQQEIRKAVLQSAFAKALQEYAGGSAPVELVERLTAQAIQELASQKSGARRSEAVQPKEIVEIHEAPPELLAGWKKFFNAEGGRFRHDERKLLESLRASLGDRLIGVSPHPHQGGEGVLVVKVRGSSGGIDAFVVPLHSVYRSLSAFFSTRTEANRLSEIDELETPGVVDSNTLQILKKGVAAVSRH